MGVDKVEATQAYLVFSEMRKKELYNYQRDIKRINIELTKEEIVDKINEAYQTYHDSALSGSQKYWDEPETQKLLSYFFN